MYHICKRSPHTLFGRGGDGNIVCLMDGEGKHRFLTGRLLFFKEIIIISIVIIVSTINTINTIINTIIISIVIIAIIDMIFTLMIIIMDGEEGKYAF